MQIETAELTIYEAEKIQEALLELLNTTKEVVELDLLHVESIDMVGIQLLISFYHSLLVQNRSLKYINISDEVRSQIALCHCEEAMGVRYE